MHLRNSTELRDCLLRCHESKTNAIHWNFTLLFFIGRSFCKHKFSDVRDLLLWQSTACSRWLLRISCFQVNFSKERFCALILTFLEFLWRQSQVTRCCWFTWASVRQVCVELANYGIVSVIRFLLLWFRIFFVWLPSTHLSVFRCHRSTCMLIKRLWQVHVKAQLFHYHLISLRNGVISMQIVLLFFVVVKLFVTCLNIWAY